MINSNRAICLLYVGSQKGALYDKRDRGRIPTAPQTD